MYMKPSIDIIRMLFEQLIDFLSKDPDKLEMNIEEKNKERNLYD